MHLVSPGCAPAAIWASLRPVAAVYQRAGNDAECVQRRAKTQVGRAAIRSTTANVQHLTPPPVRQLDPVGWFDGGDAVLFDIVIGCIFFCFTFRGVDLTLLILLIQFDIIKHCRIKTNSKKNDATQTNELQQLDLL